MKNPSENLELISGLPGEELVAPGLHDLAGGNYDTVEALLLCMARTRLTNAGLSLPEHANKPLPDDPEGRLYRLLCEKDENSAFGLYNSLRRRLNSFMSCLESLAARRAKVG